MKDAQGNCDHKCEVCRCKVNQILDYLPPLGFDALVDEGQERVILLLGERWKAIALDMTAGDVSTGNMVKAAMYLMVMNLKDLEEEPTEGNVVMPPWAMNPGVMN